MADNISVNKASLAQSISDISKLDAFGYTVPPISAESSGGGRSALASVESGILITAKAYNDLYAGMVAYLTKVQNNFKDADGDAT